LSEDLVSYERRGSAALVTINRPERRNAVNGPTADQLQAAYERFVADDAALCMVLTGAGEDAFCAGADLKDLESYGPRILAGADPMGFTRQISPKPTIAAISGYALAGGFELALWCDLRIVAEGSRFGFVERRWGVPLVDGGTQRIARVVGLGVALDLVLTGRFVELDEACSIGLVTQRVAAGEHVDAALALAEKLASFPHETMLADRASLLAGLGTPLERGLEIEAETGLQTLETAVRGAARFAGGEGRGGVGV
jgi:enoyl-CoA hydratase